MGLTLNLYCSPQDVYDLLGTEGGQLRLDDGHYATAQTITLAADAAQGSTTLLVLAMPYPLLAGTVLEFCGGGLGEYVEVVVTQTTQRGATQLMVSATPVLIPRLASAFDSGVNLALAQRLIKACQYGTSRVKLYCTSRYEDSDLLLNAGEFGSVNRWASSLAAHWLCSRRSQSPPKSVADLAKEAIDELKMVRYGQLQIEDIGTRTAGWPFLSNVTLDLGYDYRRIRVEQSLSEGTPTQFPQAVDWNSALWVEL